MDNATDNPIESAVQYLVSYGFTDTEAKNICRAIHDETPEALWERAPVWIDWCAEVKRDYECIVSLAAQGIICVQLGPGGIDDLSARLRTSKDEP
jgi:hypothetical protein